MSVKVVRGQEDETLRRIRNCLEAYQRSHPCAKVEIYRKHPYAVRVRIVDAAFEGLSESERENLVWPFLSRLDREALGELTLLVLVTEGEQQDPLAFLNREFDLPSPSLL